MILTELFNYSTINSVVFCNYYCYVIVKILFYEQQVNNK